MLGVDANLPTHPIHFTWPIFSGLVGLQSAQVVGKHNKSKYSDGLQAGGILCGGERESMREKRAADSRDARFLLAKSIAASCLLAFLHSNAFTLHIAVNDDGIHHFAWVVCRCSPPAVGATISFALKYKDSMIRRLVHVRLCVSTVNKFHIYT